MHEDEEEEVPQEEDTTSQLQLCTLEMMEQLFTNVMKKLLFHII
jgi:hypothetical protein